MLLGCGFDYIAKAQHTAVQKFHIVACFFIYILSGRKG